MTWLGQQEKTLFIGQAVEYAGTALYNTLKDVPLEKRLELPVFENTQMGMTLGLSMNGIIPVSIFPRWNFLLCAMDQLVNHADRLLPYSGYQHRYIIRTAVGSEVPLWPSYQHIGNMSKGLREILMNIDIIELYKPEDIFDSYKKAYERNDGKSTIISEFGDLYAK